jgi:hypothetical protein
MNITSVIKARLHTSSVIKARLHTFVLTLVVILALSLSACDTTGADEGPSADGGPVFSPTSVNTSGTDGGAAMRRVTAHAVQVASGEKHSGKAVQDLELVVADSATLAGSGFDAKDAGIADVVAVSVDIPGTRTFRDEGICNGFVATLVTPGAEYYGGMYTVGLSSNNTFTEGVGLVSECFEFGGVDFSSGDFYVTGALNLSALQPGAVCGGAQVDGSDLDPAALRGPGVVLRVRTKGTIADTASSTSRAGVQLEEKSGRIFVGFGTTPDGGGYKNEYERDLTPIIQRDMPSPVLGQDAYDNGELHVATLMANGRLEDHAGGAHTPDVSFGTGLQLNNLERAEIDHYYKAGTHIYAVSGQDANGYVYNANGEELYRTNGGYIVGADVSWNWIAFAGGRFVRLIEFKEDGSLGTVYQIGGDDFPYYTSSVQIVGDMLVLGTDAGLFLLRPQSDVQ